MKEPLHGIEITPQTARHEDQTLDYWLIEAYTNGVLVQDAAEIDEHDAFTVAAELAAKYNLTINYNHAQGDR